MSSDGGFRQLVCGWNTRKCLFIHAGSLVSSVRHCFGFVVGVTVCNVLFCGYAGSVAEAIRSNLPVSVFRFMVPGVNSSSIMTLSSSPDSSHPFPSW